MPNTVGSGNSICPFFLRESTKTITCEGIPNRCSMKLEFESEEEKVNWQERNCFQYRRSCACKYRKMLDSKYND